MLTPAALCSVSRRATTLLSLILKDDSAADGGSEAGKPGRKKRGAADALGDTSSRASTPAGPVKRAKK